jgi:hypothetical protein
MIGRLKGGAGSGFHGHKGRPGLEGGSVSRGVLSSSSIELAPEGTKGIEQFRREAADRMIEFQKQGQTLEQIARDGYQWRNWAHNNKHEGSGWDWAMWEESQKIANKVDYEYKDVLTAQDILDDPLLDADLLTMTSEDYRQATNIADTVITNRRNNNTQAELSKFLDTPQGELYKNYSLRTLWGDVVNNGVKPVSPEFRGFGALRHFQTFNPYKGMGELLKASTFAEALNTPVTLYRGVTKYDDPSRLNLMNSYTTCPEVAKLFAEGYASSYNDPNTGTVLERTVKFGDIAAYINPDGEFEVILPKKSLKVTKELVYKGGAGSGFHGHKGRPGFVGGSSVEGSSASNIRFTEQGNRVSKVEGVSDSIDTGIAYIIDDLHKMGYKTVQCCSGLNIDHPKDVHPGSGYIAFINSNNTSEQLQNIRNAANAAGMHIQTDDVFFSPATTVRMPQTVDMSFHSDLVKAANIEADKLVYDNNHEDTRTFLDKWLPVREEILDRLVNEHGGYIEDDSILNDIWQSFITNLKDITSRNKEFVLKGGIGSGFHGHKGRHGEVGGSIARGMLSSQVNQDLVRQANKTSRNTGAVGAKAIVPRYVQSIAKPSDTILDFGAGKAAAHALRLQAAGLNVTPYEFGDNSIPGLHNPDALNNKYSIVYASNVLNVQGSEEMLRDTLDQLTSVLSNGGKLVVNLPDTPRYGVWSGLTARQGADKLQSMLSENFDKVTRVGGTTSAPLFEATKLIYPRLVGKLTR